MLPSNQSGHSLWRKQAPHLPCSLLSHEFSLPAFFSSLNTLSVPHSVSSMGFQFHLRKLMHHGNPKPSPPQQSPVVTQPLPFPNKPSPEIHHINIHAIHIALIFMACMVGVVMLLYIVSITLRNYYSRRHNYNHSRRNTPILFDVNGDSPDDDDDVERFTDHPIWYIRTVGLQQSMIDSITVFKYRKNEGLIDGTECSVCLGEFQEDESLRLLPKCSHAFHIPCIDTWLRSHKNCPLCRAPVVSDGNSNATEVRVTVTDQHGSNVSGDETQNQETHIENFDGVAVEGSGSYHVGEFESIGNDDDDDSGKILPVRRSVSMDSSSTSEIFRDVVETHFGGKINSSSKDVSVTIGKHGSGKFKRALQKKPVSMRRSFSHNRKFLFSRHCRSQSSTLPL